MSPAARGEVPGPTTRQCAARAYDAALQGTSRISAIVQSEFAHVLPPQALASAARLARIAFRHEHVLDTLLAALLRYAPRRVPPALRARLHIGLVELFWSDAPLHALVDEAVRDAKHLQGTTQTKAAKHGNAAAARLTNALLRGVCRAIETRDAAWQRLDPRALRTDFERACLFNREIFPPYADEPRGSVRHLAAVVGLRHARFHLLVERFGLAAAEQIGWADQAEPPLVLRPNALRISAESFAARVLQECPRAVLDTGQAFIPIGQRPPRLDLLAAGLAYVQDATARSAAELLAAQPGERVLDLCAAPGGKSVALALRMQDRGSILACDITADRLARVTQNAQRLGLTCIQTALLDPAASDLPQPAFDAALVDVPCSNSGVLARRPEARLRLNPAALTSLSELQTQLIRRAALHVRPGGRLVYSTCSIENEENLGIIKAFLSEQPAWRLTHEQLTLQRWGKSPNEWRDGGYAALLQRS